MIRCLIWYWTPEATFTNMDQFNPSKESNYINHKWWDKITYPFSNLHDAIVEIWDWISNFCAYDYLCMLGLKLNNVNKRGPWGMAMFWCLMYFVECGFVWKPQALSIDLLQKRLFVPSDNEDFPPIHYYTSKILIKFFILHPLISQGLSLIFIDNID